MEGKSAIDRKGKVFMEIPTFVPLVTPTPVKSKNISLKPLPPLLVEPTSIIPEEILARIGIKKEPKPSLLNSLLGCNSCNACKAMSRETLNEIAPEDISPDD